MTTKKQVEANRRNARKSTGPRTRQGKARSRINALKHGLLAQDVVIVLASENQQQYDTFRLEMLEDLEPAGALECLLAEQVVGSAWRLARAVRMERERMDEDLVSAIMDREETNARRMSWDPPDDPLPPMTQGVATTCSLSVRTAHETIQRYVAMTERSFYKALGKLEKVQAQRRDGEAGTGNREQAAGNGEQAAGNREKGSGNREARTRKREAATGSEQAAAWRGEPSAPARRRRVGGGRQQRRVREAPAETEGEVEVEAGAEAEAEAKKTERSHWDSEQDGEDRVFDPDLEGRSPGPSGAWQGR